MPTVALATLAVTVLAYVVGRSTLPLLLKRDGGSPAVPLQAELLLGNAVVSVVGLVLAELGVFALPRLVGALAVVSVAALALRRLVGGFAAAPGDGRFETLAGYGRLNLLARYGRLDALGAALALAAYVWASPPFDTALFASDASVYTTVGIRLAEHGSLAIHDPTIARLSLEQRQRWFPPYQHGSGTPPFLRVGGGLLLNDLGSDVVLPAFQPLLSVWSAIFYGLGGDDALTGAITYFAALFVWAFASFVASDSDGWTAGIAVGLLTSLVPQYWYSRFSMPEIPSQYFLWAGLATAAASLRTRGRWGVLAGFAVGVAGLMRLDVLIQLSAALALWTAIAPRRAAPAGPGFTPALVVTAGYAALHQLLFPTHYRVEILPRVAVVLDELRRVHIFDVAIAVVALSAAGLAVLFARSDAVGRARLGRGMLRIVAGALFGAYAFAIVATSRPDVATNAAWLRIYVGWPLLAVALVGTIAWLLRAHGATHRFVLVFGLLATVQLFFYPPVSPQPLWAIRRMLRVVMPCVAIAAALALTGLPLGRWRRPVALAAAIGVLAFGPRLAWTYRQPAYEHTMMHVRSIGALVPRGAVVLGDPAFFAESQLHIALWMTRDTPTFLVSRSDGHALHELRTSISDRPMFWIGPAGKALATTDGVHVTPVGTYDFTVATRRMEPYDVRDDLGRRPISLAVFRLELDEPRSVDATHARDGDGLARRAVDDTHRHDLFVRRVVRERRSEPAIGEARLLHGVAVAGHRDVGAVEHLIDPGDQRRLIGARHAQHDHRVQQAIGERVRRRGPRALDLRHHLTRAESRLDRDLAHAEMGPVRVDVAGRTRADAADVGDRGRALVHRLHHVRLEELGAERRIGIGVYPRRQRHDEPDGDDCGYEFRSHDVILALSNPGDVRLEGNSPSTAAKLANHVRSVNE